MGIPLKELLQLPELKNSRMLAGENGLSRVVRWVHVMNVLEKKNWVQAGELVLLARQDIPMDVGQLNALVVSVTEKNAAGLGLHAGSFAGQMMEGTKSLLREKQMLLFEIPQMQSLNHIMQAICTTIVIDAEAEKPLLQLMEDILFQDIQQTDSIRHRASRLGYRLDTPSQVLIFDIDNPVQVEKYQGVGFKNAMQKLISAAFTSAGVTSMSMIYGESVILLLTDTVAHAALYEKTMRSTASSLQKMIAEAMAGLTVSVGIGGIYPDIPGVKKSYQEAAFSLRVQRSDQKVNNISSYRDLGLNRLLFKVWNPDDLREYVKETLGALIDYDVRSKTEFTATLQAYVKENGNLVRTAHQLSTHRNTLKYRMQRIQEILGCDLQKSDVRLSIQVALAICRYLTI